MSTLRQKGNLIASSENYIENPYHEDGRSTNWCIESSASEESDKFWRCGFFQATWLAESAEELIDPVYMSDKVTNDGLKKME